MASEQATADIAQKLQTIVIEHRDSPPSSSDLLPSSLVSHRWNAIARRHLFAHITVSAPPTHAQDAFAAFTLFLAAAPHIAALVRALDAAARTSGRDRNAGGAGPRPRGQQQPSEAERWGSPMPFYPSALPLPLVEDVGSD